jgi:hypothetical protein
MNPVQVVTTYLIVAVIAGMAGGAAMAGTMMVMGRSDGPRRSMIMAVGSLLTRSRENARLVGALLHGISAIGFGLLYTVLLMAFGLTDWPGGLFGGMGLGTFHGMVVSLALVWVIADQHPLEEYRETGPMVFLQHLAGHLAYGVVVGIVVAVSPL